ncbi:hypothetical protein PG987_016122 [Apiospora arundinis]
MEVHGLGIPPMERYVTIFFTAALEAFPRITVNKQRRSDAAASLLSAEAVPTKPLAMAKGTESDLIDTPPPSYKDVCLGPVGSVIGAVTDAQLMPRDPRSLETVDTVMHRVESELEGWPQIIDVDHVSSCIRQLCCFAASSVSEEYPGHSNSTLKERRQAYRSEIQRSLGLVMKPIPTSLTPSVINMTATTFEELAEQRMAEKKYSNYWQARGEFHFMRATIYRAAARLCIQLAENGIAENETIPLSIVVALANAASCYDSAAKCCSNSAGMVTSPRFEDIIGIGNDVPSDIVEQPTVGDIPRRMLLKIGAFCLAFWKIAYTPYLHLESILTNDMSYGSSTLTIDIQSPWQIPSDPAPPLIVARAGVTDALKPILDRLAPAAPVANDEAAQEQAADAAADWQPDESNEENGDAVEA